MPPGTHAVVLAIKDESSLRELAKKLKEKDIDHRLIEEIDAPYTGQATAIGIVPTRDRDSIRRVVSSLPLLGKEQVKLCA